MSNQTDEFQIRLMMKFIDFKYCQQSLVYLLSCIWIMQVDINCIYAQTHKKRKKYINCDYSYCLFAEKGSVTVFGENRLAFKGQSVLFQCQAAGWYPHPIVQWQVDHRKVNS